MAEISASTPSPSGPSSSHVAAPSPTDEPRIPAAMGSPAMPPGLGTPPPGPWDGQGLPCAPTEGPASVSSSSLIQETQRDGGAEEDGRELHPLHTPSLRCSPAACVRAAANENPNPTGHTELPGTRRAPGGLPVRTPTPPHTSQTVATVPVRHVSSVLAITITGSLPAAPNAQEPLSDHEGAHPATVSLAKPPRSPQVGHCPPVPVVQEPPPTLVLPKPQQETVSDSLSYLESASLMSGTLESLSGLGEDGSSLGSDSEVNGLVFRRTDKYGFLGGAQYSEGSACELRVDVARQREMKWLDMFSNWDKWMLQRFQKVKMRCRKGIPSSLRAKAWQLLSNSQELLDSNPGKFEALEREQGDPKWLDIIEKDLHRQFPFHEMFAARGGHGQQDLYRILKAYTVYRPHEGYCQAQAPVAAVLLMHMPAEQAFWCLVQICETYLPGYYSAGLEAIQLDGDIFFSLLRRFCPMAYRHLKKFKIDPILYMTEWFMCIFSRSLPWACVLRVWDMFFCEGVKIIFRVGLVLLRQMLGSMDKLRELQGMYETVERLRNISPESIREELLVQEVVSLPVTEALVERECSIQVCKWRESRGELCHNPGRRLHGTRAIYELKRRSGSFRPRGSFSFLGGPVASPGPLRASSSVLSLPGFRKSKAPFQFPVNKGSFSGSSVSESKLTPGGGIPGRCQAQPAESGAISPARASAHGPIAGEADALAPGEEEARRKKSKEEKKKEKEEEKQRSREQKEREKVEKVRLKKEKKDKGGA
ncbi:TBC1 domain family member 10B-like isoform X2 [Scleropages formosus]|nr:TBC1 domain family member 10B-like isoform X2 [Scleropages formosus]